MEALEIRAKLRSRAGARAHDNFLDSPRRYSAYFNLNHQVTSWLPTGIDDITLLRFTLMIHPRTHAC